MTRFPLGVIALTVVSVLVYFGLAHRVLDRMRLSDKTALGILAAMIVGSFIDIPLATGRINVSANIGGGLIPVGIAVYVLSKAGTSKEWKRALVSAAITGIVIYLIGSVLMKGNPGSPFDILDPLWIYPLVGGLVAYIAGRSRRSSFIAATIGVLMLDVFNWIYLATTKTPGKVSIGGAGAFDSIVLAGIIAVLLAEIIGETRERLQGGPAREGRPPELLRNLENSEYSHSDSSRQKHNFSAESQESLEDKKEGEPHE